MVDLIAGYGVLDEREQIGLFLRHAFPLKAEQPALLDTSDDDQRKEDPRADSALIACGN